MLPTQDTAHVTEATALLTDHFRGKPNVQMLLAALVSPVQDLENAAWDVLQKRLLNANASGVVLDWYGDLVGQPRGTLGDADYLVAIQIRIMANRSSGRAEDIIQIATALATMSSSLPSNYVEAWPAGFLVEVWNLASPAAAQSVLVSARPPGVLAVMHYSTWPAANVLRWRSRYATGTNTQGVWQSRYGGVATVSKWCASALV